MEITPFDQGYIHCQNRNHNDRKEANAKNKTPFEQGRMNVSLFEIQKRTLMKAQIVKNTWSFYLPANGTYRVHKYPIYSSL